jgi:succinoglycan biosynthesis protein ExoO
MPLTFEERDVSSVIVSVVIPAYNAAGFLGNAVASLQAQTLRDWEAIIVDDASTDETVDVANALAAADDRIQVMRLERNGGPSAARNVGFAAARGEWIAVLDADDLYLPERLATMVAAAHRLGADVLADNQWLRDPAHGAIVRSGLPRSGGPRPLDLTTLYLKSLSASGFDYGTLKPIFRTEFLRREGVRYRPFRYGEDFVLMAELLAKGARVWRIPEPGYIYTITTSEIDGSKSAASRTLVNNNLLMDGNLFVLREYVDRLSAAEKAVIAKRAYYIEQYNHALEFKNRRRRRDVGGMIESLVRHPFILVMILRGVRWRLRAMFPDQRYSTP